MDLNSLSNKEKFILSRWAYSIGEPIISDAEYSQLLAYMQNMYPDDEYVNRSWSSDPCPVALCQKVGREDLIHKVTLSDKTESIPSLNTELEVQTELISVSKPGTLSMKHDGWNIQCNYYNGNRVNVMTRGRSSDAVDVSKLLSRMPEHIPATGKVKIVMELTVSKKDFKFCASMFHNVSERSAVSTLLSKPEYHHLLSFHAFDIHGVDLQGRCKFEVLEEWGFPVPMYFEVTTYDDILIALEQLSEANDSYGFPTDGAVYDGDKRRAIRLLAWEEPIYRSFVTGYLEQYGPYRISPSILIEPILRKGTTQRKLSMTNWQRILDYNLQLGAPVAFRIASSATADFDEESTLLLHEQWKGRWDEYAEMIKENEEANKCLRSLYLHGYV